MNNLSFHSAIHFPMWRHIHNLPRLIINQWQLMEFKKAVKSAYLNIPFYQELLASSNIRHPDNIHDLSDICRLPVLTKDIYRSLPGEKIFHNGLIEKGKFLWNQTSGSTGTPFKYAMSSFYIYSTHRHYLRYSEFCKYRLLFWRGIPLSFIANKMKVAEIGVKYPRPNLRYFSLSQLKSEPRVMLDELQRFKPYLLEGSTSALLEIANIIRTSPISYDIKIPFINTHSERLVEGARGFLEEIFSSDVSSRYGTGETGVVGVECHQKNGFHIHEESFVIEIVDDNYLPLPDGERGRVLLSFFYNDVMPFLRYDIGDYGSLALAPCECGVYSKRLHLDGRTGKVITLRGRRINITQLELIFSYYSDSIVKFQIAKIRDSLEMRIIPTVRYSFNTGEKLKSEFEGVVGFKPSIISVNSIPYTQGSGKTLTFVDDD